MTKQSYLTNNDPEIKLQTSFVSLIVVGLSILNNNSKAVAEFGHRPSSLIFNL